MASRRHVVLALALTLVFGALGPVLTDAGEPLRYRIHVSGMT